ncbi:MAG: type I glyceraldehyde-3-phosphate dehydrogenase [Gammaproteobacteria bacterium CG11_big_fil_rev_8_21_14_0_20_46_22]|nr:MAG: type I glyceraldehyde-3-phosphate dehydrogenase [Gammaproteobacteria bacterium CG12_big_fil_rev_8_21_14_0_65_46_12]PIR10964.1 MAG: type I glyceraldehyde-3-phosphate dehydrogenase [Gammaproteobacteria bacterium CG11_big_fil_rev_8_21_14_0_20_46_22]
MSIRIAINGYGRIGTMALRAIFESGRMGDIDSVIINDVSGLESIALSTKYDSVHGIFPGKVETIDGELYVNGHEVVITAERDPLKLPWKDLGIDVVYECTGAFCDREGAMKHIQAGAKKVLISAPGQDVDATIVYGVNHHTLKPGDIIVSNASCTTNCLAPVAKVMQDTVGIEKGLMNTVHAYTADQRLVDAKHKDMRRARSATQSIIPTKTGAAKAVGLVLPELAGKLDGFAMRVPTANVSVVDLTFEASRETCVEEINEALKAASQGAMAGVLQFNEEPLVSIDFKHNPASSIVDGDLTRVKGNLVKVCAWYDNEWGFANRMLDTSLAMMGMR